MFPGPLVGVRLDIRVKKAEIASKQQESSTDAEQLAYIKELTLNLDSVPHNTNYDGEEEDMYYGALGGEDEEEDDERNKSSLKMKMRTMTTR